MRLVVQRVTSASVEVDGEIVGAIDRPGLLILAGVTHDDQASHSRSACRKSMDTSYPRRRAIVSGRECTDPGG